MSEEEQRAKIAAPDLRAVEVLAADAFVDLIRAADEIAAGYHREYCSGPSHLSACLAYSKARARVVEVMRG